jgi:hypothetical protein
MHSEAYSHVLQNMKPARFLPTVGGVALAEWELMRVCEKDLSIAICFDFNV